MLPIFSTQVLPFPLNCHPKSLIFSNSTQFPLKKKSPCTTIADHQCISSLYKSSHRIKASLHSSPESKCPCRQTYNINATLSKGGADCKSLSAGFLESTRQIKEPKFSWNIIDYILLGLQTTVATESTEGRIHCFCTEVSNLQMDNLMSWDNPSPFMNEISVPLCRWSNQHDTFLQSSADCRAISGEVELNEALLKSISELPGNNTCEASSDLDRSNQIMESINGTLDLDLLQHQGTINLAAVDSTLATLGQGTIRREEALTSQLRCFCSVHHPKVLNSIVSPLQHFGSLEKLRSDDNVDGVTIFSSSESIRKLSSSGNLSLGESENHDSYTKLEVSNYYPVHNEVTSQGSSKPDPRPHTKRELEDFVGREKCHPCNLVQSNSTTTDGGFKFISENSCRLKKLRSEKCSGASNIDFRQGSGYEPDTEAMSQVKEMIYRAAALRPVSVGVEEPLEKPRRKNVRISSDPQTVAARHRRERINERLRVLQRLVPGGSKMDIASMLDEAANYLKYLKSQVSVFEAQENNSLGSMSNAVPFPTLLNQAFPMQTLFPLPKP